MAVLSVRQGDHGSVVCLLEGKISVKRRSVTLHWIWAAGQPWIVDNSSSPHTERAPHPNSYCSLQFPSLSSLCVHRMCWMGCGYISYKEHTNSILSKGREFKIDYYESSFICFGRFEHLENHALTEYS